MCSVSCTSMARHLKLLPCLYKLYHTDWGILSSVRSCYKPGSKAGPNTTSSWLSSQICVKEWLVLPFVCRQRSSTRRCPDSFIYKMCCLNTNWRVGEMAQQSERTSCSFRGPCLIPNSHPSVTLLPGDLTCSSGLQDTRHIGGAQKCIWTRHLHTKNNNKFKNKTGMFYALSVCDFTEGTKLA